MEDKIGKIQELLDDSKIINEGLKTNVDDDFLNIIVNRKFRKKMEVLDAKDKMEKEKYESFHNKTFSLINNTSLITNINNFLSNRSIENLNFFYNKDPNNLKDQQTNSCEFTKWSQYTIKLKANRILPEGIQSGVFLVNINGEIKFKPLTNNYKEKSFKSQLSRIQGVINYRYILKYKALNIFFYNSSRSKIFEFENENDCSDVQKYLTSLAVNIDKKFNDVHYYCKQWVEGLINNYDYLMILNNLSSRSFSDLSQYPVMPWILKNYEEEESKYT